MQEEFRRFNKRFEVSNLGNVKKNGELVEPGKDKFYYYVSDGKTPIRVHTMVGKCFPEICGEHIPNGHYHHINHNQLDNRAENIRCISNSEHKRLHQLEDGVSVPVKAYNKEGELVGRWDSKCDAAANTEADYRHITDIINHPERRRFTAGGLFWFKEDTPEEKVQEKILRVLPKSYYKKKEIKEKRKVYQYDDGKFVKEWSSIKEAAEYYGCTQAAITSNIAGKSKYFKKGGKKCYFLRKKLSD